MSEVRGVWRELKSTTSLERVSEPRKGGVRRKLVRMHHRHRQPAAAAAAAAAAEEAAEAAGAGAMPMPMAAAGRYGGERQRNVYAKGAGRSMSPQESRMRAMDARLRADSGPTKAVIIEADPDRISRVQRGREGAVTERPAHLPAPERARAHATSLQPRELARPTARQAHSESVGGGGNRLSGEFSDAGGRGRGGAKGPRSPRKRRQNASGEEKHRRASAEEERLVRQNHAAIEKLLAQQRARKEFLGTLSSDLDALATKITDALQTAEMHCRVAERDKLKRCKDLCKEIEKHSLALKPIKRELEQFRHTVVERQIDALLDKVHSDGRAVEIKVNAASTSAQNTSKPVLPVWLQRLFLPDDDAGEPADSDDEHSHARRPRAARKRSPGQGRLIRKSLSRQDSSPQLGAAWGLADLGRLAMTLLKAGLILVALAVLLLSTQV